MNSVEKPGRRKKGPGPSWLRDLAAVWCLWLGLAAGPDLQAVSYLQEGFNYAPGILGTNPPWAGPTNLISVGGGTLSYPYLMGYPTNASTVTVAQGNRSVTYRPLTTAATSGCVYCSLLINFITVPGNYYIAGLTQSTNASPGGPAADPLDLIDGVSGSGCTLGIRALGGVTGYVTNGTANLATNTTYLVVMKYNFTNGTAAMYVNPPAGDTEPAIPDAASTAVAKAPDLSYFYLRVGAAAAGNFSVSALRVASTWAEVTPATNATVAFSQAAMLSAFLDSLQVDVYWLEGYSVNWLTGATGGSGPNMTVGTDSHCSAFAGAVADLLGIYILRQPYASDLNLANHQAAWLATNTAGWYPAGSMTAAQHLANAGSLVVASYPNPNPNDSGHIAVLRPSNRTDASIDAFGPEECQSGDFNFADTNVVTGFNQHPGAFPSGINYYAHAVTYPISPASPVFSSGTISNQVFSASAGTIVGRKYQAQWSSNLTTWTPLLSFTNANVSSSFSTNVVIKDPLAGRRFYRILAQ